MNKCYKKVSALISVLVLTGMTFANYSIDNKLIREAWYQGVKKLIEFH